MTASTCGWCAEDVPTEAATCPHCQGSIAGGRSYRVDLEADRQKERLAQASSPKAAAGWYDDPKMVNTRRYWDGAKWTDQRLEKAPAAASVATAAPEAVGYKSPFSSAIVPDKETRTLFHWGIAMVIIFPVIGLIIGIVLLGKKATWGVRIIIGAILFAGLYFRISVNGF